MFLVQPPDSRMRMPDLEGGGPSGHPAPGPAACRGLERISTTRENRRVTRATSSPTYPRLAGRRTPGKPSKSPVTQGCGEPRAAGKLGCH